jgi:hypothetical protein
MIGACETIAREDNGGSNGEGTDRESATSDRGVVGYRASALNVYF